MKIKSALIQNVNFQNEFLYVIVNITLETKYGDFTYSGVGTAKVEVLTPVVLQEAVKSASLDAIEKSKKFLKGFDLFYGMELLPELTELVSLTKFKAIEQKDEICNSQELQKKVDQLCDQKGIVPSITIVDKYTNLQVAVLIEALSMNLTKQK